jgi:hypothetical protein
MIGIQGLDRSCTISSNYIDAMGGSVCIVLRGASVGPVYVTNNIMVNSGINCIKYGSWPLGSGRAEKYISGNTYYSTLGRSYTPSEKVNGEFYVAEVYLNSYSRFLDGEVNQADYDNLHVDNNWVYCRKYFLCLVPNSGNNNTFTNNHFSTLDIQYCVKWFSNSHAIDFATFNSYAGETNIWEGIPKPDEPPPPLAGADNYVPPDNP